MINIKRNVAVINDLTEDKLKLNILRFSWVHGCIVSPEKNLDKYVGRIKSTGHCACHNERLSCPCPEAPDELEKFGYCTCRLFINLDELKKVLERIQQKVRVDPGFRPDK